MRIVRLSASVVLLALVAAFAVSGCGSSSSTSSSDTTTSAEIDPNAKPANPKPETGHWSYSGADGPTHWADLNSDYKACGDGTEQSGIDFTGTRSGDFVRIALSYKPEPFEVKNNGHAIEVAALKSEDTLALADSSNPDAPLTDYVLAQFHFHAPSEHTLNGKHFPVEVHFVHQAPNGKLAVVGVFVEQGETNPTFAKIASKIPSQADQTNQMSSDLNPEGLIPPLDGTAFRYDGSLTTPPCTEGVIWTVYKQPVTLSASQIEALTSVYSDNARPVQPIGDRVILRASGSGQ
jgi:carbonic anhydrase